MRVDRRNDRFSALNWPTDGKRFPYRIASCIKEKLHREHQKKGKSQRREHQEEESQDFSQKKPVQLELLLSESNP
jgi:hypothetical protein